MQEYYRITAPTCKVDVLGTEYMIYLDVPVDADDVLKDADGYTDKSNHKIVIADRIKESDLDDYVGYRKKVIRHELVHAFLFESGLGANAVWKADGEEHPEMMVDWIAAQFPKLIKAYQVVGAL